MGDYWTENGIKKPRQIVVAAACKHGATVLVGPRHWDRVIRAQYDRLGAQYRAPIGYFEQGFLDQFGDFLTREDALRIAKESGQALDMDRNNSDTQLFSEGLY